MTGVESRARGRSPPDGDTRVGTASATTALTLSVARSRARSTSNWPRPARRGQHRRDHVGVVAGLGEAVGAEEEPDRPAGASTRRSPAFSCRFGREPSAWVARCAGGCAAPAPASRCRFHFLGDERVIAGDLRQALGAHQIGATVAALATVAYCPRNSAATSVVPIGRSPPVAAPSLVIASLARRERLLERAARHRAGLVADAASNVSMARRLATSPSAWPPIPSATARRKIGAGERRAPAAIRPIRRRRWNLRCWRGRRHRSPIRRRRRGRAATIDFLKLAHGGVRATLAGGQRRSIYSTGSANRAKMQAPIGAALALARI